ncbi:MAG: hypothetical protein ACHP9T_14235 [Caulobacterales bacterium]|jgi:hypothetical protein
MASQFSRRRFAVRRAPEPALQRPALPGSVVDAVLRFHDEEQDQGSGCTLLRLSPKRLRAPEVKACLGKLASRAANVAILWNEDESQIIRVLEAA